MTATLTADPITGRCMKCHKHSWLCTCDGQRCTATSNGDRCQLRPHAGTGHQAKHGAHTWISEAGPCVPEARCTCCDGHDGLGCWHFATVDDLRAWLAGDHEQVCDIDLADIPGEPYGMAFVTAGEAAAWLEEHDLAERYAADEDRKWERRAEAAGVKL